MYKDYQIQLQLHEASILLKDKIMSLNFNDIVITKEEIYFSTNDELMNFNFASCNCD